MDKKPATPKDAAAVILLNESGDKTVWAQRNPQIAFLGGWHAFPGGKLETNDALVEIENCAERELGKFIACAARETFEEVGVLLARGGEKLTRGQRASLHDDLISGRMTFTEILEHWNLRLDATDFHYTGFWTTPQFSPVRFKTRFFLARCPPKQQPYAAITELENVEFIAPQAALEKWQTAQVLISPPVLLTLKTLAEFSPVNRREVEASKTNISSQIDSQIDRQPSTHFSLSDAASRRSCAEKLLTNSQKADGQIRFIELNPRVIGFPLKTETLPPATHTNCFIVGRRKFVVIDAAAKIESEQAEFHNFIDSFLERGYICQAIITTHLHQDHTGGETALQTRLKEKFDMEVPLAAHRLTAQSLAEKVQFQTLLADGDVFFLEDENGRNFQLKTLYSPGHARGHLAFYDEEFGFLLSGDNVVNSGSIIIAPPEGDMKTYLESLERMKNLSNLRFLCGSHGAAVYDARGKINEFIAHRLEREKQILEALKNGAKSVSEIVERVYIGLKPELSRLAEKSVEAHLEKIESENLFSFHDN